MGHWIMAVVSHNHHEGIKGAQATSTAIYLTKDFEIAERVDKLDETEMLVDSLENCRTAIKKYAEFIKSIIS